METKLDENVIATCYPKIHSVWKRKVNGEMIAGNYAIPEFKYLENNNWIFTEKIDGMNIRVIWDGENVIFSGRTDRAVLPGDLRDYLANTFTRTNMASVFDIPVILFGEGYGGNIQQGGNYRADKSFILFDILRGISGNKFFSRESLIMNKYEKKLGIDIVPIVKVCNLDDMEMEISGGIKSLVAQNDSYNMEGVVGRPAVEMLDAYGSRVIVKIKSKDYL